MACSCLVHRSQPMYAGTVKYTDPEAGGGHGHLEKLDVLIDVGTDLNIYWTLVSRP
jgi:hypothetical protein